MKTAGHRAPGPPSAASPWRPPSPWGHRRYAGQDRFKRSNLRALFVIVILACAAGYTAYKQWTTKAPYRHWSRHWTVPASPIIGRPWVIDGDTIDVSGMRVRLEGIDAPESGQACTDARGQSWPCGMKATQELRAYLGNRELSCAPEGYDRYRRVLAICSLAGSDVNAWMVRQGWALAYGYAGTYQSQQDEARAAKRGIWAGTFTAPQQWRQSHR
jgi:endonuclease YncB( thermonuclease family)